MNDPLNKFYHYSEVAKFQGVCTKSAKHAAYILGATTIGLSFLGALATDNKMFQDFLPWGVAGGMGVISTASLLTKNVDDAIEEFVANQVSDRELLHKEFKKLQQDRDYIHGLMLERQETIEELSTQLKQYDAQVKWLEPQLAGLRGENSKLLTLKDETYTGLVRAFTEAVKVELTKLVRERLQGLGTFIYQTRAKHSKNSPTYTTLTKQLVGIADKVKKFNEIIDGLTPDYKEPHNDLVEFVDIFNQLHDEVSSLKVKFRNTLNVNERLKLQGSVDRKYAVEQLEKLAHSQDEFQLSYTQALDEIERLLEVVDQHRDTIHSLKEQLETSKTLPVKFNPASRDDLRAGNIIIEYFYKAGIWLDRGYSKYKGYKAVLAFHADRTNSPIPMDELNKHGENLQDLLKCLNKPEFKRNTDTGMVEVTLEICEKPKEPTTNEIDVSRLWKPASEFKSLVEGFSRVRITGGSEAGKSPTAENLAVCILNVRNGSAVLYNPQFNSSKNYWTIPTVGKSHEDSSRGIKELAAKVDERSKSGDRSEHQLYIFDEVDSTLGDSSDAKGLSDNIKFIIKQASHQNLSAIFIGQSANVSNYKGMQRTDWNSAVNIHIGANAYDAIQNSNTVKGKAAEALIKQADNLTSYCESKNIELGLDGKNPKAYRFALVMEPSKAPYFIELPEFGLYTYKALETPSSTNTPANTLMLATAHPSATTEHDRATATLTVTCPSCGTEKVQGHGSSNGKKRYKCLNDLCSKKTFSV